MKKIFVIFVMMCLTALSGCKPKEQSNRPAQDKKLSILVYITGVVAGSPSYEMLVDGAKEFADENGDIAIKVYEAGFNQAEWEEQLRSMVSGGEYDLVLGTNPSLPELCANVGSAFPAQKFIITDAQYSGNPQISTWLFNQYEQALFLGYLSGLVATANMPANDAAAAVMQTVNPPRIGFIAAQEFPLLNKQMVPGFLDGARLVNPSVELDFRVIGNWFDANKAADLSSGMINSGVTVITSIAGGASRGIIRTIKDRGVFAVSFNTNEYSLAPGNIIGCGIMEQKKLVKEILADVLSGKIQYGIAATVGVKEGYLNFISDDPGYRDYVPVEIQNKFASFMNDLRSGQIAYTVPPL